MEKRLLTAAEQVAACLRDELARGRWSGTLPGIHRLSAELGFPRKPVEKALLLLEKEGVLLPQGAGRRRRIAPSDGAIPTGLRVGLFLYEPSDRGAAYIFEIRHRLMDAGITVFTPERTLTEMAMDVKRVARVVKASDMDAWVVVAGSVDVLSWFASEKIPAFALLGRMRGLPIAGGKPDKIPAQTEAVRRLVALGHRRIVKLVLRERVDPAPGAVERAFLHELESLGVPTNPSYNLTVLNGGREDFYDRLHALFRDSPPSALFFDYPSQCIAAQQYLARRGILSPESISLICNDPDAAFGMCEPTVSHISWEFTPLARLVLRWLNRVARGKEDDHRQSFTKAKFVAGGTLGPAPGKK